MLVKSKRVVSPLCDVPLKLNLGCGKSKIDGFVNCDMTPSENTDLTFDLQERWPFKSGSVSDIYCSHTLEHLANYMNFFEEAYRVLKPMGLMVLRMPYGMSRNAMADITHLRPWYPESFACFQPGYSESTKGNHYEHNDRRPYFWAIESWLVVDPWLYKVQRIPFIGKSLCKFMVEHLTDFVYEFWVVLQETRNDNIIHGKDPKVVPCYLACWDKTKKDEATMMSSMEAFKKFNL